MPEQTEEDSAQPASAPSVFELPLEVTDDDLDAMGHVNNVVYLRWIQEAAAAHWFAAATPEQQEEWLWVVSRHEIDYLRPALPGERLIARTWVGEASGARFDRHVEIWRPGDNQLLAKARSVWVALDKRTRRPRRVNADLRRRFFAPLSPARAES